MIDGLPIPSGIRITVELQPERFELQALTGRNNADWKTYELSVEKITNVQLMDERQIRQVVEQSASGMILGAAAFGTLGAMVGGRTKTKEKINVNLLLVIDYFSGEAKQIVLNVSDYKKASEQVVKRFREMKPVANDTVTL